MAQKKLKPAPLVTAVTGFGWISSAASDRNNSKSLPEIQNDFLIARYRLDATRARLTAELAWGR